ncbi:antibiotic biosynthesis monooxygenase [Aureitalea sp. L0-47]|uniref:putative quinol monooxygenase n=1 Tax=Aureitalea sp. L0-47 TaxID=2816962 RepID=UPI002237A924|nr:putative quinol monooxygenase [Aureitalea sp. L0-47]MCW5519538.1 antibiotic biosynthesis monooxygenase [Aureitalea sp. L0-47]
MKPIRSILLILTTLLHMGIGTATAQTANSENAIITVRFKAQPDKGAEAVLAITKLLEQVKKEPNFVSITMHVDAKDDTNILLYEVWSDASYYYGAHMETPHLQQFMTDSRNFLAGPPEIVGWKLQGEF